MTIKRDITFTDKNIDCDVCLEPNNKFIKFCNNCKNNKVCEVCFLSLVNIVDRIDENLIKSEDDELINCDYFKLHIKCPTCREQYIDKFSRNNLNRLKFLGKYFENSMLSLQEKIHFECEREMESDDERPSFEELIYHVRHIEGSYIYIDRYEIINTMLSMGLRNFDF